MSFAACGEAKDVELVTTMGGAEGKGNESVLCEVSILFFRGFVLSIFTINEQI